MKRWIREPLAHFLILGAGLFLAFQLVNGPGVENPGKIVVTQGKIEHLSALFARTWQRPPTEQELQGLIQEYVREEVLYREGMAIGLDRDDTVIRRRIRQKMEFIAADVAAQAQPTETELREYLEQHPDAFRIPPRLTFRQVYLNPDRRGDALGSDAQRLLEELNKAEAEADMANLGDSILLDHEFKAVTSSEVARTFGERFAAQVAQLPVGQWNGPVTSGYGVHLVLVEERTPGRLPALNEVRNAVEREWASVRRLEAREKFYRDLLKRYTVTIERPRPVGETNALTAEAQQ